MASELHTPRAREMLTYLVARIVPALASMALTFLCIHSLSVEAYGVYSLTLLPATVAVGLVGGLSAQSMLRYGNEMAPDQLQRGLYGFPLKASALILLPFVAYIVFSIGWHAGILFAAAWIPLTVVMDTRRNLLVARGQAHAVLVMDGLRAVSALVIAGVLFLVANFGADLGAVVPLLALALSVGLCLWLLRIPAPDGASPGGTRVVDRHYLMYGLWFAGWLAVLGAVSAAERSVVEATSGLAASGRYAAQADIVNAVFAAVSSAMAAAMMPIYLADHGQHAHVLRRLLGIGVAGIVFTGVTCVVGGLVLHGLALGQISQTLTGDVTTGLLLVLSAAIWSVAGFVQKPLELSGRTRTTFVCVVLAFGVFLGLAPWWGAQAGPAGVAGAKLAAGLCFLLFAAVAGRKGAA
jgi:hypothetical protein